MVVAVVVVSVFVQGVRASMAGFYSSVDPEWLDSCVCDLAFRKLLFGLTFMHATVTSVWA